MTPQVLRCAFEDAIQLIFGSKPEFQYFEAPIVIDNAAKEVVTVHSV